MLKQILPFLFSLFIISTVTAQKKTQARAYFKSGINLKSKNKFPEALAAFTKAISLDNNYDSAFVEIGNINLLNGYTDYAINNFKNAISINPQNKIALFELGKIYRDVKPNYDSAIIFFKAAVAIDSMNKEYFYSIAWCYNAKGDYENAIQAAIKALERDNTYRPAYGELGHAYRRAKKFTEAIEQFKKNLAVSVVDLAYFYSGMCYTELNDKEGALKQYEELKKINEKMAGSLRKKIDSME